MAVQQSERITVILSGLCLAGPAFGIHHVSNGLRPNFPVENVTYTKS